MKRDIWNKIFTVILFAAGIFLSWGGMLYATNDPDQFKVIGIIISLAGYGIFFWVALREEQN